MCLAALFFLPFCAACAAPKALEAPPAESLTAEALPTPVPTARPTPTPAPDIEGPVISGAQDLTVAAGSTVSYRDGVSAVDDRDGPVALQVDSSGADLSKVGEYPVLYWAEDSSGNRTEVPVTLTVTLPDTQVSDSRVSREELDALAGKILARITRDGMSQKQKARAIYNYVHDGISYVGDSDKSNWIDAAYTGFTRKRGDCYTYFACAKALLTCAGIPNVDVCRAGGPTNHYWQLVDVGGGYYHFDACPHLRAYPIDSFLLTEEEAKEYSDWRGKNYYIYDYDACPVKVENTPMDRDPWHAPAR